MTALPLFSTYVEKRLSGTPAMGFAVKINAQMIEEGTAPPNHVMVAWDDKAVICIDNSLPPTTACREPVGIITYTHIEWRREVAIKLGYVLPDYRNRGLYRLMWSNLLSEAIELKAKRITGVVYSHNNPMRAVAKQLGRTEESINLVYEIK